MNTKYRRFAAMSGLVLVALLACSSQTRIEKLYTDPEAHLAKYGNLLVIGIAGDADRRQRIEDLIVARLTDDRVSATAAYTRLGTSPVLLQDAIDEAARSSQSDGILIAHLVSASETPRHREGRVDVKTECRGGNPVDLFLYEHEELREPDSVTVAHEVTMVTNLYNAGNGKRIWTVQSTCFDKAEFDAVLRQEAKAIVRQLRTDGLLQSGPL